MRERFRFKAGALENLREGGQFKRIIDELGISKKIEFVRSNLSIIIIMPDYKIKIMNNHWETINYLQDLFPSESRKIYNFFDYLLNTDFITLYSQTKNKIFSQFLEDYFSDKKLKAIIKALVAQIGVPSEKMLVLTVAIHLREFIFDSGYYPLGGLQRFSEAFADILKNLVEN
ncbi:MAG: hypothetical protein NC918_08050 [Candidatus Omnitrophica bacterium]|nr:hypothetical protein [Candidatus Omnitrophota bacterium]